MSMDERWWKLRTNTKKEQSNICIITFPRQKAGITPLSNLIDVLYHLPGYLYVVTGNEGDVVFKGRQDIPGYSITHKARTSIAARIFGYIYLQLWISYRLIKLVRNVDIWIFFMGEGLLLPVLTLKLLGKPVILSLASSLPQRLETDSAFLHKPLKLMEVLNYALADKIVVYSPNLIKEWNLEKHRNKISIAHEHFINLNQFKIQKRVDERQNLVGYVGRLSEEKGVLNFVKAIPEVLEKENAIKILIVGEGQLRDKIEEYLNKVNLNNKVKLVGWSQHDELPDYLNVLKLVVLPSYTEGLPNIMLEAMACGTPVLATPVGVIPDVIKDGWTGFIMDNNSPECIAKNVISALNHANLDKIVKNARELVEKEYTYEAAVERYRQILKELS